MLTREEALAVLQGVPDPEVPVISVVELGVVRDVQVDGDCMTVIMTPTYSGCPAMREMEADVKAALLARGVPQVEAEPQGFVTLTRARPAVACPFCGSADTQLQSEFGSTACKAIHTCRACGSPFDEFKAL
ncbi:MAG: DUF59 domain-containing protein [Gemmatimonadaceae bacterium]|nr:DUF59 domain-containing protein [Gemmatimonadaceae bacterium]